MSRECQRFVTCVSPNFRRQRSDRDNDDLVWTLHSSFKLVQIGVGSRVTQRTAHGNDLAFVMKRMRQDMMKDERRSADGDVPVGEMKLRIGIELLIGQVRQISMSQLADFLL
jgi:hypothetical protein